MMLDRLEVEEIEGEPLRYFVTSRSRVEMRHLVDLAELNCRGRCGCEHFSIRLDVQKHLTCDHIKAAQIHLAKKVAREVAKACSARKGVVDYSPEERSHEARGAKGHPASAVPEGSKAVPARVYGLSGRSMAPRQGGKT